MLLKDLLNPYRVKFGNTRQFLKNVYIDKLDEIVNKYCNTFHSTIEMKPVDVKPRIYLYFNVENDLKKLTLVTILGYKNIFAKGYIPNWSEEVFLIRKVKNNFRGQVTWTYIIKGLKRKEIVETFY